MTSLGLTTTAAPEAAALFPLSAAVPPAAEDAAADASAFGDLLAASFSQAEQPQQSAGADNTGAAFSTLSLADIWFAGLNVDLHSLNASLDAEETAAPAEAMAAAEVPADDAPASDAVDDADAALMALAGCIPGQVPVPVPELVPVAVDETPEVRATSELVGLGPQANTMNAIALEGAPEARIDDQTPTVIDREAPRKTAERVPHADLARAAAVKPMTPMATVAAASVVEVAAEHAPAANQASVETKPAAAQIASGEPSEPNKGLALQASVVEIAPTQQQTSPVEEQPKAQFGKVIDAAPSVQQTGRTVAELYGGSQRTRPTGETGEDAGRQYFGQVVGRVLSDPPTDSQSQSQNQDGSAQDAFVTSISANVAAARSADSAAVMPVFTVAPPVDGGARAVPVEGAALPPAPPAATVPAPENVGRLIESMRVQMKHGIQEATVRLNPEHLGEVTISVRVERGAVSAVVHAETAAVQQWLESQEDKLRSGLSDQGLHLERFIVQRDRPQERREQRQQQPAPRYKQQRDDTAIRFEVLV